MKYTIYNQSPATLGSCAAPKLHKMCRIMDSIEDAIDMLYKKFPILKLLWDASAVSIAYNGEHVAIVTVHLPLEREIKYYVVGEEFDGNITLLM